MPTQITWSKNRNNYYVVQNQSHQVSHGISLRIPHSRKAKKKKVLDGKYIQSIMYWKLKKLLN